MDRAHLLAQLQVLNTRLDSALSRAERLAEENHSLRQQQEHINTERSQLLAKNEQARTRVEAMIARLKALEQNT